jgi:hypothetical protein
MQEDVRVVEYMTNNKKCVVCSSKGMINVLIIAKQKTNGWNEGYYKA